MSIETKPRTAGQLALLRWIAGLGAVTAEALAQHAALTPRSASKRLLAGERAGLLCRSRLLTDTPALYTVTRAGVRACELSGLEPARVTVANATHTAACALAAAALERAYPDHRVMGERELRRQERAGGVPLASVEIGGTPAGGPALHCPDLVLWPDRTPNGLPVAVEVELTLKSRRRLLEICRGWARCRRVAGCLYLVDGEVHRPLLRAIEAAGAADRIAVVALETLLDGGSLEHPTPARTVPSQS